MSGPTDARAKIIFGSLGCAVQQQPEIDMRSKKSIVLQVRRMKIQATSAFEGKISWNTTYPVNES